MTLIESLLPGLHSFLAVDLNSIQLPSSIEQKRRRFLERIEVLSLGSIPPPPESHMNTSTSATNLTYPKNNYDSINNNNNNNNHVTVLSKKPLSSIARFFSNKRYSLPPTINYPSSPVCIDPSKTVIHSPETSIINRDSRNSDQSINEFTVDSPDGSSYNCDRRNSLAQSSSFPPPPPLPPKKSHLQKLSKKVEDPYEVPKQVVTPVETVILTTSSAASSSTVTPVRSKSSITSASEPLFRRKEFSRLSLSPQSEIIQADSNSITPITNPDSLYHTSDIHGTKTIGVNPIVLSDTTSAIKPDATLVLPKKYLVGCQTRRPSSLMDSIWTLAGVLSHRCKPNKWIQLNICLLTNSSRLIAYKTGHSVTPSLALFLCGSTGIYSGRDSGMEHVIKIAHFSREIIVLAAPTEEQALIWVRQINQYSQGITPTEVRSFLPHFTVPNSANATSVTITAATNTTVTTINSSYKNASGLSSHSLSNHNFTSPKSLVSSNRPISMEVSDIKIDALSHENNRNDRLFQPIVNHLKSLSLEESSCVMCTSHEAASSCSGTVIDKTEISNTSGMPSDVTTTNIDYYGGVNVPLQCQSTSSVQSRPLSMTLSSTFDAHMISSKQNLRRNSLISSMRRKVESFNSKRRARKSLPQSLQPNCSSVVESCSDLQNNEALKEVGHRRMLSDGQWSCSKFSSVHCLQQQQIFSSITPQPLPPPAAACLWDSSGSSGKGFGWSQLETAGARFLNQNASSVSSNSSAYRPRSMCYDSSGLFDLFNSSQINVNVMPKHGPLLDLNSMRSHSVTSCVPNGNQVVISGNASISIPGRVSWTTRWCCLKSNCLEIYLNKKGCDNNISQHNNPFNDYYMDDTNWPLFSLPLEPGKVELGLARDKRHSSAIRLAVPTQCSAPLLFDVADKLQMGAWIRGFIQALGLISPTEDAINSKQETSHSMRGIASAKLGYIPQSSVMHERTGFQQTHLKGDNVLPTVSSSWVGRIPNSIMETSQTSVYYSDIHEDGDNDAVCVNKTQNAVNNPNFSNTVIYDEVCPPQTIYSKSNNKDISATITPLANSSEMSKTSDINLSKRRWSSPLLIVESSTKIQTPGYSNESNTSLFNNLSSHWHIPPPSRRLLAQPLPPLPSVGPSTCESIAGTITSCYTSSNITPDDFGGYQDESLTPASNIVESDGFPEFWCRKDGKLNNCKSSQMSAVTNHRRYASMSSLEYAASNTNNTNDDKRGDDEKQGKKTRNSSDVRLSESHNQSHSKVVFSLDDIYSEPRKITSSPAFTPITTTESSHLSCTKCCTSISTCVPVDPIEERTNSSSVCSTSTLLRYSDVSNLHRANCDRATMGTCIIDEHCNNNNINVNDQRCSDEINLWELKSENTLSSKDPALVEYMKTYKLISARRCVSCLSGNKPTVLQTNSNVDGMPVLSSTLPVRSGSDDPVKHITGINLDVTGNDTLFMRKSNSQWNRGSFSSNSSRTATSSGVALSSSPGSGGNTRPPSLAIPGCLPVTPVEEEQCNIEDFSHHTHHFNKELSDSVPFNVEQQSSIKKYKYSDYVCQVEIPSSVSFMSCHHNHHYTHVMNKVNSNTMHVDSISSSATSLLLIASQLEEVKQETNSLRSRK
ncbi:unnamed protein product [Trichobilharzia szidati]|nr:unnamed protein product [Trichobilharzia szidati]